MKAEDQLHLGEVGEGRIGTHFSGSEISGFQAPETLAVDQCLSQELLP